MEIVAAYDKDKWAVEVYNLNHFPHAEVADLSQVSDFPDFDGLIGGPPCQPFSIAGEKQGEYDPRDCIPHFLSATERFRPKWFLMENVPNLISKTFTAYVAHIQRRMQATGYVIKRVKLNAADYGVPQLRYRVFWMGVRADLGIDPSSLVPVPTHSRDATFLATKQWEIIPEIQAPGLTINASTGFGAGENSYGWWRKMLMPTVTAKHGFDGGAHSRERFTEMGISLWGDPRERIIKLKAQGFPLDYFPEDIPLTHFSRLIGNAVPPPVAQAWGRTIEQAFPDSEILSMFCGCGGFDFIALERKEKT